MEIETNLVLAIILIGLMVAFSFYRLACIWYYELHHGGWDEVYKPTTNFISAIIGIAFLLVSLWIIATIYTAAIDRQATSVLNTPICSSESGHKKMLCPE